MLHLPHAMRFAFFLFGCTGLSPFGSSLRLATFFTLLSLKTLQKKFCHTDENKFSSPSNAGFQNRGLKFAYLVQSMENEVLGI